MSQTVTTEAHGPVRLLRINRPDVHNCVDGETAVALAESIETFAADDEARVLVVTGAGDSAFCSGADLKHPLTLLSHRYVDVAGPMGFARLDPGKPTIAAVNGYCFAGGLELAAWCDIRVATVTAEFGCLSRRWGVPYTDGGTQRLARIIGQGNALYLLMSGARIDARRAYEMGLVQEVVAHGEAVGRALELAGWMASYPNQAGIRADRAAALATFGAGLDDGLRLEAQLVRPTLASAEMAVGLRRFASGARDAAPIPPGQRRDGARHQAARHQAAGHEGLGQVAAPDGYEVDDDPGRIDRDAVWDFLCAHAYWGRWRSRRDLEAQIDSAWRVAGAYEVATGETVGFARAVSDGVALAYLADVYVLAEHRGRGLGAALVDLVIERGPGADFRWMLHTSDAHALYRRFGFAAPDHSYLERPAGPAKALTSG